MRAFTADEEAVRRTLSAHHDRMTEVFDFRLAVESFAAKYAAERRTKADLRELRQLLAAMDELRASMHGNDSSLTAQFVQADTRFHLRIAETARSLGCAGFGVDQPASLGEALDAALAADGPAVVEVRVDPAATPIHSYRRRLEQGGTHPRPGTVYQLPAWRRSPPAALPAGDGESGRH